jgi:hypothetical protein
MTEIDEAEVGGVPVVWCCIPPNMRWSTFAVDPMPRRINENRFPNGTGYFALYFTGWRT